MSALGQKQTFSPSPTDVRFTNGVTVVRAPSIRRRSAAWTILLDWTYRSRTRASALWMTRARSFGKLKLQASPKRCCKCCGVLLTVLNGSDWKLDRCRNGCSAHLVKQTYR